MSRRIRCLQLCMEDKFSVCVTQILSRMESHNGAQQRWHSASRGLGPWDLVSYKLFAEYRSQSTFGTPSRVLWTKLTDLDLIYKKLPTQTSLPPPLVKLTDGQNKNWNSSKLNFSRNQWLWAVGRALKKTWRGWKRWQMMRLNTRNLRLPGYRG